MRQHEALREIIDPMGLYETEWDTDTIGDIVRQYETRALWGTMRHHEILWDIMRHNETAWHTTRHYGCNWTVWDTTLWEITKEDSRAGRDRGRSEESIRASQERQCPCSVSGLKVDKPQTQGTSVCGWSIWSVHQPPNYPAWDVTRHYGCDGTVWYSMGLWQNRRHCEAVWDTMRHYETPWDIMGHHET